MPANPTPLKIRLTKNYDLFKRLEGNRVVRHAVERMVEELRQRDHSAEHPILVFRDPADGKLAIADGQKRFEAAKALDKPIHYIVAPEPIPLLDIARRNSFQTGWSLANYLHLHCTEGNAQYIDLRAFVFRNQFPISLAIEVVGGTSSNGSQLTAFKNGDFVARNLGFAQEVADVIKEIEPRLVGFRIDRALIIALLRLMRTKRFDQVRFVRKLDRQRDRLTKCTNWRAYVHVMDAIYNDHAREHERVPLSFLAEGKSLRAANRMLRRAA